MKKLYIETYGCQMNFADSEVVAAILKDMFEVTKEVEEADLVLINTCSIREKAEQRIHKRLQELESLKRRHHGMQVGLLGCMAERMKEELLQTEPVLDFIAGPDAYRSLPQLIADSRNQGPRFNVMLSEEETYEDIIPVRYDVNGVSAYVSIMRGCNNFCSYCVVPYTRGRERSRSPKTILGEVEQLLRDGFKEVTLLGQNVNSYHWEDDRVGEMTFAKLMAAVADLSPDLRVRFATSHPKDISDELIETIARYDNICKYIHLPVQSGSDAVLKRMNRSYTRDYYMGRVRKIKELMPDCAISTDIIAGFCGETLEDHQQTLEVMREVGYEYAYMFKYSERGGTLSAKRYADDVPDEEKTRRLEEIIALQGELSLVSNQRDLGKTFRVLVEGASKRSADYLYGRNSQNKVIIFPKGNHQIGEYIDVAVKDCTAATLFGD
ncbi:MAG: tRNA (N6-isopentenyl adenosine(37)-C2)-methylthiotransferase MiaB [Bacteroidales bacterium]|nr:tRNA (N6-isopentenyl adenosine(37)-C2)-methylthiotransferase MiaB [Bacteroidales bacterium]MBO7648816.1 tRNA (N6-isopentenyl adenosine(37)-C2)-methylthiotransferase MiaB [Bacteroidales bacterium]MCR4857649.1 tRNA (N6-isopentenyl adenosine(37)-C2)-methylthiotransferase MiaB [Bacteroidales bacterium]